MGLSLDQAKALGLGHLHPAAQRKAKAVATDTTGGMNKTETRFSQILEAMRRRDLILAWDFEPEKFRMADRTWFLVDFRIVLPSHQTVFIETKARKNDGSTLITDDGAVKLKTVAEQQPYAFFLASYNKDGWRIDRLPSRKWGKISVDIEWEF